MSRKTATLAEQLGPGWRRELHRVGAQPGVEIVDTDEGADTSGNLRTDGPYLEITIGLSEQQASAATGVANDAR